MSRACASAPRRARGPIAPTTVAAAFALLACCHSSSNPGMNPPSDAGSGTDASTGDDGPLLNDDAGADAGREPGATRIDDRGVVQVWVPPGGFTMGTDEAALAALMAMMPAPPAWVSKEFASEKPAHAVRLTKGYWIDKTEVTNASFQAFVDGKGYDDEGLWSADGWAWRQKQTVLPRTCAISKDPMQPRVCITWFEAEAYAKWRGGRLPTEAEWEFAARGPDARVYPWGNDWDPARAQVEGAKAPATVGSFPEGRSWVGALDMAGNAMEWVHDWLDAGYYATLGPTTDDPPGAATGTIKIEKGGWWGSNLFVCRAAYRHYEDPPTYQDHHIGVRVVSER